MKHFFDSLLTEIRSRILTIVAGQLLIIVALIVVLIIFWQPIADKIRGIDKIEIGGFTIYLNQALSLQNRDVEGLLTKLGAGSPGVKTAYLREKIEAAAGGLKGMQRGELEVKTSAAIFDTLLFLVRNTQIDLYSVQHRPQGGPGGESEFSYTYDHYLQGTNEACKRGVQVHRLFVIPRAEATDQTLIAKLKWHRDQCVKLKYAFLEEIKDIDEYKKIDSAFINLRSNIKSIIIKFGQMNIAMYDHEIIVHTLVFSTQGSKFPTKLKVTWRDEDLRDLNPEPLFRTSAVHDYLGEEVLR